MKPKDEYTFKGVYARLQSNKYDLSELADDVKLFIDVLGCFFVEAAATTGAATAVGASAGTAGAVATVGAISFATVIAAVSKRSKLLDAAKRIIGLLSKKAPSYTDRYERMRDAYVLLWVASFFDAYTQTMPEEVLDEIALTAAEKATLIPSFDTHEEMELSRDTCANLFPDVVFRFDKVLALLMNLYTEMANRLRHFVSNLAVAEEDDDKKQRIINSAFENLPKTALRVFKDQYLTLCANFNEFYVYLTLEQEIEVSNAAEEQYKNLVEMILRSEEAANHNFSSLEAAIRSLPVQHREEDIESIIKHIQTKYQNAIKRSVVETEETDEWDNLSYPPIEEIFVPQRYKILEYDTKDLRLELESSWTQISEKDDILAFWARYILDPQSTEHIVLVLGDPGGGKSILTDMVSAQICSEAEFVVKIPLRKHISDIGDLDIEEMICEQIEIDGDVSNRVDKLKKITGEYPTRPITLIFDGYDEVQQATGMAYPSFLPKLKRFQKECNDEKRPVRIVVTSRRTLIDKAVIPRGTVVLKLLEFNYEQKETWIDTWNQYNHEKLHEVGLNDFVLPNDNKDVDDLSGQPLLLLILAIYDADFETKQNALQRCSENKSNEKLNRTKLYDELIRRFIRRELWKGSRGTELSYENTEEEKREELVSAEIEKLGIAALGMFVRERLSITIPELTADFEKLNAKTVEFHRENSLKSGEVFLGSFFFIHDSRAKNNGDSQSEDYYGESEHGASFVFLHKTFYEFLVADYVLSSVFKYSVPIAGLKTWDSTMYLSKIRAFDDVFPQFYTAINGAPLCSEPEIVQMIAEWGKQKAVSRLEKIRKEQTEQLKKQIFNNLSEADVFDTIGDIIKEQTKLLQIGKMSPNNEYSLLLNRPLPQRNATYLINLVTLRILIEGAWETERGLWQYIAQYVKMNAPQLNEREEDQGTHLRHRGMDTSEELPLRFMALFQIQNENDDIIIRQKENSAEGETKSPLDSRAEVFCFQQDKISNNLYRLHSSKTLFQEKKEILHSLAEFDYDFFLERDITDIQNALLSKDYDEDKLIAFLKNFLKIIRHHLTDDSKILSWMTCFRLLEGEAQAQRTIISYYKFDDILLRITNALLEIETNREEYRKGGAILLIWLDVLQDFNAFKTIEPVASEKLLKAIRKSSCSSGIRYAYTDLVYSNAFFPNLRKGLHHNDMIFYKYERSWNYYYRERLIDLKREVHSTDDTILTELACSLLSLRRASLNGLHPSSFYFNSNETFLEEERQLEEERLREELIKQISMESCANRQISSRDWNEMPFILRELVMLGAGIIVREYLIRMSRDSIRINEPSICDYLSIADAVSATGFILSVYDMIIIELTTQSPSTFFIAFLKAAISLISHNSLSRDRLGKLKIFLEDYYLVCILVDPVKMTKLFNQLIEKKLYDPNELYRSHNKKKSYSGLFIGIVSCLETVLQQSPLTAIVFLRTSKRYLEQEKYKPLVDNCINQALVRGDNEVVMALKSLLL